MTQTRLLLWTQDVIDGKPQLLSERQVLNTLLHTPDSEDVSSGALLLAVLSLL